MLELYPGAFVAHISSLLNDYLCILSIFGSAICW